MCCNPFIRKFTKTSEVVFLFIYLFTSNESYFASCEKQGSSFFVYRAVDGLVTSSHALLSCITFVLYSKLTPAAFTDADAFGFCPLGVIYLRAVASLPLCFYLIAVRR